MSKFIDDKIKALQEGFNEYAQERHGKDGRCLACAGLKALKKLS